MPALDDENIVFGRVLEGLGAVAQVAAMPTFQPNERLQALNQVASLIGDDRAAKARILAAARAWWFKGCTLSRLCQRGAMLPQPPVFARFPGLLQAPQMLPALNIELCIFCHFSCGCFTCLALPD